MRKGFNLVELSLALVIMGIVTIGILYALKASKANYDRAKEIAFSKKFEYGLKNSFEQILNNLEPLCGLIENDSDTDWGWKKDYCSDTTPFPELLGKNKIVYYINFAVLPAGVGSKIKNAVSESFSPYCQEDTVNSNDTQLVLICSHLKNLEYEVAAGTVNNPKDKTDDYLDPSDAPVVKFTYERVYIGGNKEDIDYSFNMSDVYAKRQEYSLDKFFDIKGALKDYYEKRLTLELLNTPPKGLHSTDDEYVPWFWLVFGDKSDPYTYPVCDRGGGDTCANLNTDDYWRSGNNISEGLIMRRLITHVLNGENRYAVDGFLNEVNLYPLLAQCNNTDIASCSINAPALPQKNYYNLADIPHTSVLFSENCSDISVAKPAYCRINIIY